jgi:hypothetical protein
MHFLHISFHRGCALEIEYVFTKLGHTVENMKFNFNDNGDDYNITHQKAQICWDSFKGYFNTYDGIITSDTCPNARTFLQNNWSKLLIIWVVSRFDYSMPTETVDPEFYNLLRDIPNRKNVRIFGNHPIENIYAIQIKNVNFGDFIIKPLGKNTISENITKKHDLNNKRVFYVPPYHNETIFMNLTEKLNQIGVQHICERFPNHISDLLEYTGVICIPYAFTTIAFFERMQLGIVTFIPSMEFIIELAKSAKNPYGEGSFWFQTPFSLRNPNILYLSDWYSVEYADMLVYFNSWEDLVYKINTTNYEEKTRKVLEIAKKHNETTMAKWRSVIDTQKA